MRKIRIGQIGIGHNHGEAKMLAVRKFPELFEVVGYAEEDEEWIKKRGCLKGYEGLVRLSAEEVIERSDAVLIECDVWNLTRYADMCIKAGKHVHMDKPASGTPEEFSGMLNSAREKGLVVQMGYMYRYNPAVLKCLEYIKEGRIGEIYSINAEMSTEHPRSYREWLRNFKGGGMYIFGCHLVDLIVYMLGEPKRVSSYLTSSMKEGVSVADTNLAVLEYDRALARVFVSSVEVNGWGRRQIVVSGERGTLSILPIENECKMTFALADSPIGPYEDIKETIDIKDIPKDSRYDDMMRDFYDYVNNNKQNPYTYDHDLLVAKIMDEIVCMDEFYKNNFIER